MAIAPDHRVFEAYGYAPASGVAILDRDLSTRSEFLLASDLSANAIAVDRQYQIYVACETAENPPHFEVQVFAPGASGAPKPIRTIEGSKTGLALPRQMLLDGSGYLYVANAVLFGQRGNDILVFAPGANGNQAPVRTIGGANTGLTGILDMTFGADGNIYVANLLSQDVHDILAFPMTADGDVAPVSTLQSGHFGTSLALGLAGELFLSPSPEEKDSVAVYAPGASGNDQPIGYFGRLFRERYEPVHIALQRPWYRF